MSRTLGRLAGFLSVLVLLALPVSTTTAAAGAYGQEGHPRAVAGHTAAAACALAREALALACPGCDAASADEDAAADAVCAASCAAILVAILPPAATRALPARTADVVASPPERLAGRGVPPDPEPPRATRAASA